jgi:hypothetical protein
MSATKSGLFSGGPFMNDRPAMIVCHDVMTLADAEWRALASAH